MKWLVRLSLIISGLALIATLYLYFFVHEDKPQVISTHASDMTEKMLRAIDKPAWDTLHYAAWSFREVHHYVWDRLANNALIEWEDKAVHLNLDEVQGLAFENGVKLQGEAADELIQSAWSMWCNDSFWFGAPYKIKDPGTSRTIARDNEGKEGLLVSYVSGGVTPGDQYLWYLDDNGRPTGFRMWVQILPIGGVYASWEDWHPLIGDAVIAQTHQLETMDMNVSISNIKGGQQWADLGFDQNPIKL